MFSTLQITRAVIDLIWCAKLRTYVLIKIVVRKTNKRALPLVSAGALKFDRAWLSLSSQTRDRRDRLF